MFKVLYAVGEIAFYLNFKRIVILTFISARVTCFSSTLCYKQLITLQALLRCQLHECACYSNLEHLWCILMPLCIFLQMETPHEPQALNELSLLADVRQRHDLPLLAYCYQVSVNVSHLLSLPIFHSHSLSHRVLLCLLCLKQG